MSTTLKMGGGDIILDTTGAPIEIQGLEKATQDVAECYLNVWDADDPPWYSTGAEFHKIIGLVTKYGDSDIGALIETKAHEAIERLIASQEDDPFLDDDETIIEIVTLRAFKVGHLSWAFYSQLLTDSEENINTGFTIDLSQQLPSNISPDGDHIIGIGVPL